MTGLMLLAVGLAAAGYLGLATRQRFDFRGWSGWRTASFLAGCGVLAVGLAPGLLPHSESDFRTHTAQHLLVGMYAPLGLVLGAPVTLALRSAPPCRGRRLGRLLRSRPAHAVANPTTALLLSVGGLVALLLTPLYTAAVSNPALHHLAQLHFLLAGYLFAWVVAGPDPAPHRPSVPVRLVVLGVAVAAHTALSQLTYAGVAVDVTVPPAQRQGAATLMYYGGDLAELLLAAALVATWRRSGGFNGRTSSSGSSPPPAGRGSRQVSPGSPAR